MKTKHTQGNWIISKFNEVESTITSENGIRICEVKSYSGESFNDATYEEQIANSKLISSAPELLEALMCAYLNCRNLTPEADQFIKSVILKATV